MLAEFKSICTLFYVNGSIHYMVSQPNFHSFLVWEASLASIKKWELCYLQIDPRHHLPSYNHLSDYREALQEIIATRADEIYGFFRVYSANSKLIIPVIN